MSQAFQRLEGDTTFEKEIKKGSAQHCGEEYKHDDKHCIEKEKEKQKHECEEEEAGLWVLEELDRAWFCDNVVRWPFWTWIRTVVTPLPPKTEAKPNGPSSIPEFESIEMGMLRPLNIDGLARSTGDLPRARLKRLPRRQLLSGIVAAQKLFKEEKKPLLANSQHEDKENMYKPATTTTMADPAVLEDSSIVNKLNNGQKLATIHSGRQLKASESHDNLLEQSTRRRRRDRRKHAKSLTNLEIDELRGFNDLGFKLNGNDVTPCVISMFPASKTMEAKGISVLTPTRERVYPSHPWSIRRPDSPLLNLRIPDPNEEGVDMKAHLRFWARTVASTIRQEC